MGKLLVLLVAFAGAIVVAVGWAFKHLPWWQAIALVAGLLVVARFAAGRLFTWGVSLPFKWKGAALKGATIQVNSVTPVSPITASSPATDSPIHADPDAESDGASRDPYLLDVTVTPPAPTGKFTHWGPHDLTLVKPESKLCLHGTDDEDSSCAIKRIEVDEDGQFKQDEGLSYAGPQRLKLLLAVQPGVTRLKFRYYFEEFGEVTLPLHPDYRGAGDVERNKAA